MLSNKLKAVERVCKRLGSQVAHIVAPQTDNPEILDLLRGEREMIWDAHLDDPDATPTEIINSLDEDLRYITSNADFQLVTAYINVLNAIRALKVQMRRAGEEIPE